MPRIPHMLMIDLIVVLVVYSACGGQDLDKPNASNDSLNWGNDNTAQPGSTIPGGGGYGSDQPGGTPGSPPTYEEKESERCNIDDDCPTERPFCGVSGYCFECISDDNCAQGSLCNTGLCMPQTCTPGEKTCSGYTQLTCDASGSDWTTFVCPGADGECVNGECTGCAAGSAKCVGKDQRLVCLPDGSGLVTETCGNGFCVDGLCLSCYPGQRQCDGDWAQVCSSTGIWEDTQNCGDMQSECAAGVCLSPCGQTGKLSNEGCDYWAIDMDNEGPAADSPYAVIVSNLNAFEVAITVTSQTSASGQPVTVAQGKIAPGQLEVFELPQQNMGKTGVYWKALRLESTGPIVAYQFNPLDNVGVFSNDASLLLPSNTFGQEYVVVSREEIPASGIETFRGSIAIVATAEETKVTITPSAPTMGGAGFPQMEAGETTTVTLQPYQVLNIQSDMLGADLTGTIVTADKPIGVFGGHEAAVGSEQCCADHLEQQLFPVSTWGKNYVATKSKARGVEKDYWRIVAATDGTSVTVSPSLPGVPSPITLKRGDFYEFQTDKDFVITSTEAVLVAQTLPSSQEIAGPPTCLDSSECADGYSCSFISPECMIDTPYCESTNDCPSSHSCACGDLGFCTCEPIGDPALILSAPVEQYRSAYVFLTPTNYLDDYINIIAPKGATVKLDDQNVSDAEFKNVGDGSYRVARIKVNDGMHRVEATAPVGVIAYGYDDDVSYGYPAGLSLTAQP
jgi:hypothetical protein